MPSFFDRAVEFIILIGVWVGVGIEWQMLQQKRKQAIKTKVSRLLKSLGVRYDR